MTTAALYIRVSSIEQANEGYSLPAQEAKLRAYCAEKGYQVYNNKSYADEGISAKDMQHRPAMLEMMADAQQHKFDVILVWKLTRFSRSLFDLVNSCADMQKHDVYLESISEAFDARTSSGRMILGVLGSIAQWEREVIGENVRLGVEQRAKEGHRTCPYILGYDTIPDSGMKINKQEADIVRYIYQTYISERSVTATAELCRRRGYVGKRGVPLSVQSVYKILTRYTYCGYYAFDGKIITPAAGEEFPAIISPKTYNQVQQLLTDSPRCGRHRKYPLVRVSERAEV